VGADGTIYAPSDIAMFACPPPAPPATNSIARFFYEMPYLSGIPSPPVLGNSGTLYFGEAQLGGDPNRFFYAVRPGEQGECLWRVPVDGCVLGAAVDALENIYFGTSAGTFYALDASGRTLWTLNLGSAVGLPALGPDGVLYVGTTNGLVSAIQGAAGPGASTWPQFQRNAQHTGSMETYLEADRGGNLTLFGVPTRTYRLERAASLTANSWQTVTNVYLPAASLTFTNLVSANSSAAFYRAVLLP
jgi:outer membrane protein assembly factor BamB